MAYAPPGPPAVQGMWQLLGEGAPLGYFNKCKVPQAKPKATKVQGAGNPQETKFPSGLAEYDDLEVSAFQAADGSSLAWIRAWVGQCTNSATGQTGVTPEAAKRTLTVIQLGADGSTQIAEWKCYGCFPLDPGSIELEAGKEEAVVLDMKFSVDRTETV